MTVIHLLPHRGLVATVVIVASSLPKGRLLFGATKDNELLLCRATTLSKQPEDFARRSPFDLANDLTQARPLRRQDH